jgi:hypothetical protein
MTGSPADENYATLSGYWEGWEDFAPEYRQSTTACCPRETIPDSCGCPDGCACLCADCECGDDGDDDLDYFDAKWENDFAADLGPED